MSPPPRRESELYPPVKRFLEAQGYEVKSEVCGADAVARRGDEEPVIVELKTAFSLALIHQAIERQRITDAVYVAVPLGSGRAFAQALARNRRLCRRLGLGLLLVRLSDGFVEADTDPGAYRPRRMTARRGRLLREFARRVGDPNTGGMAAGTVMTAYRQDALRCARLLAGRGPTRAAEVAAHTSVERARRIMADDHYGWFERTGRGIYSLTPKGRAALEETEMEETTQ